MICGMKITYLLFHISHSTNHMEVLLSLSLSLSHIQQRQWHEMANKIKNEKKNVTQPTLPSLSFAVCQPHEEDSLRWMVFFSSLHLDHEWITENIRVHTLTYDLWNENHLFAFSPFLSCSCLPWCFLPSFFPHSFSSATTCSRVGSAMNTWKP